MYAERRVGNMQPSQSLAKEISPTGRGVNQRRGQRIDYFGDRVASCIVDGPRQPDDSLNSSEGDRYLPVRFSSGGRRGQTNLVDLFGRRPILKLSHSVS